MAIIIEVANPRRENKAHQIGTIDTDIPGAQELIDSAANYYEQLFTDEKGNLDLTRELLFYEMLNAFMKQVQAHTHMRVDKEKEESDNENP